MKYKLFLLFATIYLTTACSATDKIKIQDFKTEVGVFEPLFVNFTTEENFTNPYDPDDIKADAVIVSPNKEELIVPCFFVENKGQISKWQARFTPRQTGLYSMKIKITSKGKEEVSEQVQFTVKPSGKKGLLSFDKTNAYFLKYDNGEKFRGLGLNVGWAYEPKWDTRNKYTFNMFFDAMHNNQANFLRMWICPWNYPIEWTPVVNYQMLTEEFSNWDLMVDHSKGLELTQGTTPVTQADEGQLLKNTTVEESILYKLDSIRAVKLMIYYKGDINKNDIEILSSADNKFYSKIETEFSESWESSEGWRRIFLFSFGEIPQAANYIKVVFKSNIHKDKVVISGIQFRYGKAISQLDCYGLSRFSRVNSEKLDSLFNLSLSKGIYMMLTLGYHGQFNPVMDSWGVNDEWQRNPYNVKNGGPCEKPADFFSNKVAKKHYKNYLRYFVARWGYNPVIVSWEFWNEIDIAMRKHNVPEADIVSWHMEMSDYLNSVDPYNHIITTSLSGGDIPELWKLENIDLTQIHRYQPSIKFVEQTTEFINRYKKPHIIGEYALSWKGPGNDFSDEQYEDEFHDGMWRGFFAPVSMLPLSWWWDYHYDKNQYFHFKPLASAIEEMKKQEGYFTRLQINKPEGFDLIGLASPKLTIIWIKKLGKKTKTNLIIPASVNGKYNMRILNTRTNEWKETGTITSVNNTLNIYSIDLEVNKDIAVFFNLAE